MTRFVYEARTQEGEITSGEVRAGSRRSAGGLLKKRGLFVTRIRVNPAETSETTASPHATPAEVAWHFWQLSMMVETGLSLSDALGCLARQAQRASLRALLQDIERRIREGSSMSAAMEAHPLVFPTSLTALVHASELSGAFKDVLRKASQYLMNDLKASRKMKGALIYPALMIIICVAVTIFLLTAILPKFADVFAAHHATLPLPTRILISLSDGLVANWPLWLIGASGVLFAALAWLKSVSGKQEMDRFLVSAPVVGPLFNAFYQSRSFAAMALMIESHVPLLEAIRVAQSITRNSQYQALWRETEEQVRVGERFAAPFLEAEFISESVAQVIDNGDRNGKLGQVFTHLAEYFEEEHRRVLTTSMQLLEPIMIVMMGGIVGFVAVALMLPLVQASQIASH